MVYVVIVEGEFIWLNDANDTKKMRVMKKKINYKAFFLPENFLVATSMGLIR